MSLRPAEPVAAPHPATALRPTTSRSLAAVLAAGQQHHEAATALRLFGKADYAKKFREALMELEDAPKKEANVKKVAAKLTTEQIKELEMEFRAYEERGWQDMADNTASPKKDSWKGSVARLVAQRKVLRAHYALVLLHTFAPNGDDIVELPMRPDNMGAMYHALSRWPHMDFTRGTEVQWRKIRDVRDYLEQVNDVLRRKQREKQKSYVRD